MDFFSTKSPIQHYFLADVLLCLMRPLQKLKFMHTNSSSDLRRCLVAILLTNLQFVLGLVWKLEITLNVKWSRNKTKQYVMPLPESLNPRFFTRTVDPEILWNMGKMVCSTDLDIVWRVPQTLCGSAGRKPKSQKVGSFTTMSDVWKSNRWRKWSSPECQIAEYKLNGLCGAIAA